MFLGLTGLFKNSKRGVYRRRGIVVWWNLIAGKIGEHGRLVAEVVRLPRAGTAGQENSRFPLQEPPTPGYLMGVRRGRLTLHAGARVLPFARDW